MLLAAKPNYWDSGTACVEVRSFWLAKLLEGGKNLWSWRAGVGGEGRIGTEGFTVSLGEWNLQTIESRLHRLHKAERTAIVEVRVTLRQMKRENLRADDSDSIMVLPLRIVRPSFFVDRNGLDARSLTSQRTDMVIEGMTATAAGAMNEDDLARSALRTCKVLQHAEHGSDPRPATEQYHRGPIRTQHEVAEGHVDGKEVSFLHLMACLPSRSLYI